MKIIDLTHIFNSNTPVYPGDPKSTLEQVAFLEKDTYNDHKLTTVMHVGTHIDAPLHMISGGKRIDQIESSKFIGDGILIDVRGKKEIDIDSLEGLKLNSDSVILLFTDRDKKYGSDSYYEDIPYLTEAFAQKLADAKVKMVGMDMLGPDLDAPWPAHKILLGSEVLILENLANLDMLVGIEKIQIIAIPPKLESDAAPVRVVAVLGN